MLEPLWKNLPVLLFLREVFYHEIKFIKHPHTVQEEWLVTTIFFINYLAYALDMACEQMHRNKSDL